MDPTLDVSTESIRMPPRFWFIASGTAAALLGAISVNMVHAPLWVTFVLLPTSITSFDPSSLDVTQEILKSLFVFGGSFLLWGTAGLLVGNAIQELRHWRHNRSRRF
ncbi:MAG: hypothetical protein WBE74_26455 [Terracidiphilus sp.]